MLVLPLALPIHVMPSSSNGNGRKICTNITNGSCPHQISCHSYSSQQVRGVAWLTKLLRRSAVDGSVVSATPLFI